MELNMSHDNGLLLLHKCWGIKCEAFTENKCWNKAKRFLTKLWGICNASNYVWQNVISVCLRYFMKHEVKGMNWSALSALRHLKNDSLNVLKNEFQYAGSLSHNLTHYKITFLARSVILVSSLRQSSHQSEQATRQITTEIWENVFQFSCVSKCGATCSWSYSFFCWHSFESISSFLLLIS